MHYLEIFNVIIKVICLYLTLLSLIFIFLLFINFLSVQLFLEHRVINCSIYYVVLKLLTLLCIDTICLNVYVYSSNKM